MIAPGLRVIDVEPEGFGLLCSLVAHRGAAVRGELHVLHDGGRVLRVVHTHDGPTREHRDHLGPDLFARARELRAQTGADRVVLVDRGGLTALAPDFAACGPGEVDQPTMFRRSNHVFWSSPAVVTDPSPPSPQSWERLESHLRSLGEDWWGLLAGYDGDECVLTLVGRVVAGQLVHLTSLMQLLGSARPPVAEAVRLVEAAESLGPVPFVLVAPLTVLRTIGSAPDLPAALSCCAPQALISRGLPT